MNQAYQPNKWQRMAKARFHKHMKDHSATLAIEDLSLAAMQEIAKAPSSFEKWAQELGFMDWFLDRDTVHTRIAAALEIAVERMVWALEQAPDSGRDALVTIKDQHAIARTLMELADYFPKKNKQVVFADKRLNAMDEQEVAKELEEYKKKMLTAVKN